MTITATPSYPQNPKVFSVSIGSGDAQAWKLLTSGFPGLGAGANGAKITAINAAGNDSSARNVQLAIVRSATVTMTQASPCVVTWTGHNFAAGDQLFFGTTGSLYTGLTAGTTYYVLSAGLTAGTSFEVSASAGGSAVNTSSTQSGTHTGYIVRPITTVPVAITAGTDGSTATANLLSSPAAQLVGGTVYFPGLPTDNDNNPYIFLESGDYLAVSALTTVTANKIITVQAFGANF